MIHSTSFFSVAATSFCHLNDSVGEQCVHIVAWFAHCIHHGPLWSTFCAIEILMLHFFSLSLLPYSVHLLFSCQYSPFPLGRDRQTACNVCTFAQMDVRILLFHLHSPPFSTMDHNSGVSPKCAANGKTFPFPFAGILMALFHRA